MSRVHRDRMKNKKGVGISFQRKIQLLFAVLVNGYAAGFARGKIFAGKSKAVCVPVLNCYSCPGALGACPIGSLQAVLGGVNSHFPFYVLGLMDFSVPLGLCRICCTRFLHQSLRCPKSWTGLPGM